MKQKTIKQLNHINQNFYHSISEEFSASRQHHWPGWKQLVPVIKKNIDSQEIKILDLACGNGRFAHFLDQNLQSKKIIYTAVDNNQQLLDKINQRQYQNIKQISLIKNDMINNLIKKKKVVSQFDNQDKFELITVFGFFHHLPGCKTRQIFLQLLANMMKKNSLLIFTAWQFNREERFKHKIINPEKVNIQANQLETNDYILDWQRGKKAYRYCHYADYQEIKEIIKKTNFILIDHFYADGKSGKLNLYLILRKTA